MALVKLADAYPNYKQEIFGGDDIKGYDVYTATDEKVGSVYDALVDETGRFRYLVIDTGFWVFGKKVLAPIGRVRMDYDRHRAYITGLTKDQAERLPEYNDNMTVDYDYEERVRGIYRPTTTTAPVSTSTYDRNTYNYEHDRSLYDTNEQNHQKIKLYEERLLTNKQRQKTGEVAVGKHVETETARVSVPIEKERVIIERSSPTDTREVTPGAVDFQEGEVARMEVYEETADIQKKAYVREEVSIRKEVERDTVDATETIRREELDIDVDGKPMINKKH
ncbi:DUF2382 domain-containing protein [Allocoleopsis franciscana]|uniref:Conserved domain protein, TIGR02271+C111 n=1 Tax=Allocoleopsis franciscana PCC 7113 TaxID=1173027 RepID=K9W848_9CYAN|nr:DUF2382 domain-containing protein [Allocoleopsis franciscana]AFZ16403.1 conserved domain protein, TIGR02271+C111 [Allocoleopsis franciscana PCC 7113]